MIDRATYRLSLGAAFALAAGAAVVLMVLSAVTTVTDWNTLDPEDDVPKVVLADIAPGRSPERDGAPADRAAERPVVLAVPASAAIAQPSRPSRRAASGSRTRRRPARSTRQARARRVVATPAPAPVAAPASTPAPVQPPAAPAPAALARPTPAARAPHEAGTKPFKAPKPKKAAAGDVTVSATPQPATQHGNKGGGKKLATRSIESALVPIAPSAPAPVADAKPGKGPDQGKPDKKSGPHPKGRNK